MTLTGSLERTVLEEMHQWILEAWRSLLQDVIARRLEVTGICNKMKGSEGDFFWHQSNKESCQEDMTDSEEY
jgi:hypothetical protein